MARKWLNLFAGAALSFAVAGNALADEGKITVFAAASLTNAMQDIATQFKKEKGVDVVSSFASSSTLARQIEAGAPADLFISADQKWMDYAVDKKAIDTATRQTLLGNSLVVVAPKASVQKDFTIDSKTNWTSLLNGGNTSGRCSTLSSRALPGNVQRTSNQAKKIPNGRLNSTAREETFRLNKTACHSGSVSIIT